MSPVIPDIVSCRKWLALRKERAMKRICLHACLLLITWLCIVPAAHSAAGYDQGKEAYDQKDYATAFKIFSPLAEKGDARAQGRIGTMYHDGLGVPEDYKQAFKWLKRSALQGDQWGQLALAELYDKGQGVPRDNLQAYKWYCLAAKNPNSHDSIVTALANGFILATKESLTPQQIVEGDRLVREFKPRKEVGPKR
jgi:hypothetical protein